MGRCNHEEADTRLVVHLLHALRHFSLALVQTGDTDVIVILLCNFHHILATNDAAQVWISFQAGTTKRMINLNDLAETLGSIKCKALALFHAFTGSDSTSSFKFKGKRFCYKTLEKLPSVLDKFSTVTSSQFQTSPSICEAAQDFVCTLYDSDGLSTTGQSSNNNVDLVRMDSFCRRTKDVERISPTSDSLVLHLKRSVYQSSIWASAFLEIIPEEDPEQYGWQVEDGKLVPIWMTLPLAKDVFHLEIKCSCTKQCANCKCIKNKLKCTRMCKCKCIQ